MADNFTIQGDGRDRLLVITVKQSAEETLKRAFVQSQNINVFPCSRRGQFGIETVDAEGKPITVKANGDPEARLNTERTNRLRTSINGFTDSFIGSFTKNKDENGNESETGTLIFALAGYRMEVKEFNPANIATALGIDDGIIYAHLSLHDGIPFGVANYYTEILYRQSTDADNNYIDVEYADGSTKLDFFMGVSFTTYEADDTIVVNDKNKPLKEANLPLFSKSSNTWKLVEASKLPKVEHDTEPDSIKLSGDFTVEHTKDNGEKQTSFKITKDKTTLGPTEISELDVTGDFTVKQVSDEGEEISFEITKHGVGTVNVPLHITKGTTIDGGVDLNAGVRAFSLIVGAPVGGGEIFPEGTIKAKGHIETPTLEATESIKTPTLDVKSIENNKDSTGVNINDNLNVATGHAAAVDTVNVNTINSRQENGTITVESPVTLNGNATLNNGLEVAVGDTNLQKLSAKETNLDSLSIAGEAVDGSTLTVNGTTTITDDLVISGTTSAPTLKADTIITTNANSEITVKSSLKVTGKATLADELEVTKKATLNNGLKVANGDTDLRKLAATELKVAAGALTVTKDEAEFTKPVTVDSSLTANNVQIKDQGQVPALELYHFKNGPYQLRFKFNTAPTIIEEK